MENSSITNILGPLVLSFCLQCFFAGMAVIQATCYYARKARLTHRDTADIFNGGIVGAVLLLIVFGMATAIHTIHQTVTLHFGDVAYGGQGTWATWVEPAITATVGAIAHVFFIHRCWLATNKSRTICGLLVLLLLVSLGSGIAVSVFVFHAKSIGRISTIPVPMGLWLSASAVTDIAIAISLIVEHLKNTRNSGLMRKIIELTLQTGAVPAVVAVLNFVIYFAMRSTTYHLLAELSLPSIYALSVLAALLNHETAGPRRSSVALGATMTDRVEKKVEIKVERNVLVWPNLHSV
ncbi:hypothetical protein B0H16DRAFT_1738618 [Mycena metata]|uniref:DUF6534 domain-containing protein n=1 Tax=Mycena metata TaxID=1033252 RepID=A0AAD7MJR7_9AGAR|nr:hypothetical protein B0H16DRAFT_1738618 [Mycena metata]